MQPVTDMVRTVIFIPRGSSSAEARDAAVALRDEILQAAHQLDPQRTQVVDAPEGMSMALIECSCAVADQLKQKFPAATIAPESYVTPPRAAAKFSPKFRM